MSTCSILDWLSDIPDDLDVSTPPSCVAAAAHPRKRRRIHPPAPERSKVNKATLASGGGGRRAAADDTTPRPYRKRIQTPSSASGYSLPSRSSRSASSRLSPQKHLNAPRISGKGIRILTLERFEERPATLEHFLGAIDKISRGRGILPPSSREGLQRAKSLRSGLLQILMDDACFDHDRERVGHVPEPQDVVRVFESAIECAENWHAEPTWNIMVHYEILRLALRPPGHPQFKHLVNFMPCSTASLIPEYIPSSSPLKKVDVCIHIEPTADLPQTSGTRHPSSRVQKAIDVVSCQLVEGVCNFTSYSPLRERPIALSIETKKTGEGWEGAALQMGVWQAAHWEFLERLMADPILGHGNNAAPEQTEDAGEPMEPPAEEGSKVSATASLPEFIPGIIIQGHEWNLVVSTRDGDQTVLWTKTIIGSTDRIMGIYQIIHGLQVVRQWVQNVYWPPLRDAIIRIGESAMDGLEAS